MNLNQALLKANTSIILLLLLIFIFPKDIKSAESWRGPAHFGISSVGTFILSDIPTILSNDYKIHNLYIFSSMLMLTAGFGKEVLDEIVPGKKFSWEDIGIDVLGITLGVVFHYFLTERKKRIKPKLSIDSKSFNLSTKISF